MTTKDHGFAGPTDTAGTHPAATTRSIIAALILGTVLAMGFYGLLVLMTASAEPADSVFHGCGYVAGIANVIEAIAATLGIGFAFLHLYCATGRRAFSMLFAVSVALGMVAIPSLGVTMFAVAC